MSKLMNIINEYGENTQSYCKNTVEINWYIVKNIEILKKKVRKVAVNVKIVKRCNNITKPVNYKKIWNNCEKI